jgi:MFS transporter, UMF1 family
MKPAVTTPAVESPRATRPPVLAWALWDWGGTAFNTVILTFVFSVYLADTVGDGRPEASAYLGYAVGAAGFAIALLAPAVGQRADAGRRKLAVGVWTLLTIATVAGLFGVRDDWDYLWLGLVLLGLGTIFFELAVVPYNAMLRQVSTPATIGRVSGLGYAMGFVGGIVLLLAVYYSLIVDGAAPGSAGFLGVPTADGLNIRLVALVAAVWFLVFAIPLFLRVPEVTAATGEDRRLGLVGSYRKLVVDLRELYRTSPHTVYYLCASALFRDGINGVATFGAVLAVSVYGVDAGDVLLFGIAVNVVAAVGALGGGLLEDRIGPKAVIVGSLLGMLAAGTGMLLVSGPVMFWVFGLLLTVFLGPSQSSARTFLARLAPPGHEGQLFGVYATTGRAVSFLSPSLFGLSVAVFGTQRAGLLGILLVLAAGLVAMAPVRLPGPMTVGGATK